MPELRQDLVTQAWVAVATERGRRPHDFAAVAESVPAVGTSCPFCEGNEHMTPPEVMAYRAPGSAANGPGWELRVVSNLYPAFGPAEGNSEAYRVGLYTAMNGLGLHEVLINSPRHAEDLGLAPMEAVERVVRGYIDRYRAHEQHAAVKYTLIIVNHGRAAGASREHPHAQLFGIPLVPPVVEAEIRGVERYRRANEGRCPYCDIIDYEIGQGERIVYANDGFVVMAPFASRVPFECLILPRRHDGRFERMSPEEQRQFAEALRDSLGRLRRGLSNPPYNFFIHTAPHGSQDGQGYHWHLEVLPKLSIAAGFELGSGIMIDTVTPEQAAAFLRGVADQA